MTEASSLLKLDMLNSLQLQDLEIRFRRSSGSAPVPAAPAPAAAPVPTPAASPITDSVSYSEDETEETFTLVSVKSQKVGLFRRCRYVNTKQVGKTPIVTQGSTVKAGQPMAYIEQLGTFSPVEVILSYRTCHVALPA
jgi:biotin carboxyl carrier protein